MEESCKKTYSPVLIEIVEIRETIFTGSVEVSWGNWDDENGDFQN